MIIASFITADIYFHKLHNRQRNGVMLSYILKIKWRLFCSLMYEKIGHFESNFTTIEFLFCLYKHVDINHCKEPFAD